MLDEILGRRIPDHVAVYLPQAYNYAGNLLIVPKARAAPLPADGTTVMTFVISEGVSGSEGRQG